MPTRVLEPAGVAGGHADPVDRHAELVGDDLREHRLMSLTLRGQAGRHDDRAVGLDLDVAAFVRADAGALDVAREPDADLAPLAARLIAKGREVVPADQRLELGERGREVSGVVLERAAVLEDQAVVVGHLLGLDEVARPHLCAVEPQVARDRVHHPLHHVAPLRPASAAVRRHEDGVGVEAGELDPVGAGLVRPEQLRRGDDRHDQAVGRVRAVVVPELHRESLDTALVVVADLDLVDLPALMGR